MKINGGSYQLRIVITRDIEIEVGARGKFPLKKGLYIYTGSAMRNLEARVARHARKEKTLRWHIDFLLNDPAAKLVGVDVFLSREREECVRNRSLISSGGTIPIDGFGSSDCRDCPAHLVAVDDFQILFEVTHVRR